MLTTTALALSLLASGTPTNASAAQQAPPGMVLVQGGKTTIGTDDKDVEERIRANKDAAGVLAAETPQQKVEVADFFLMVTEVTNEQYAVFLRATGAKPPHLWGREALDAARVDFLKQEGEARRAAAARGERLEREKFDDKGWWDHNWKSAKWEVPAELLAHPVTFVDFDGASGYTKWAGLRLMTEFEFDRAARRDGDARFPWGDDWQDNHAATLELETTGTWPVGSFPDGNVDGVYDLAGNVWEWTSSPFSPFDGYKVLKVRMDRNRTVEALARFDASQRVVVGGSHSTPRVAARISTRQGSLRSQTTDALGFRCAATPQPGLDAARALLEQDIALNVLPEDLDFSPESAIVARHWSSSPGTAGETTQMVGGQRKQGKVEGYAVIEKYDQVLFVPADKANAGSVKDLGSLSEEAPVHVGFLSLTMPLSRPALEPGTYFVTWRKGGKSRSAEGEGAIDWSSVKDFHEDKDQYVFLDLSATPVAASPAPPMLYDRQKDHGRISLEPYVPPTPEELAKLEKEGRPAPPALDTVRLNLVLPGKSRGKAFLMELPLLVEPAVAPTADWRYDA